MSNKKSSLIDRPVQSKENEALGLDIYCDVLTQFIKDCDTPITIGLQGDWGIGKTSLMQMMQTDLERTGKGRNPRPCIYLNTWQYAQFGQEDHLSLVMLRALVQIISKDTNKTTMDQVGHAFTKLTSGIGSILDQALHAKTGVSMTQAYNEEKGETKADLIDLVVEYKENFATVVDAYLKQKNKDRLVVMIDDLDRVAPEKALDLLSSIKVFLDVDKCVFVLAVDYDVIQRGVAKKMGISTQKVHGKSFFDKIIQVPFNMPVSAYKLDNYLIRLLRERFLPAFKLTEEQREFLTNITRLSVGSNPRSIKRVVNYVTLLKAVVQRNRAGSKLKFKIDDALLLYPLACLQLAWPEVFHHFVRQPSPLVLMKLQEWDYIKQLPQSRQLFDRTADPDQLISNITGFFDEYIDLVDTAKDGTIHVEEFKKVWDILQEANLTSVKLENNDKLWKTFMNRVRSNAGTNPSYASDRLPALHKLFTRSQWNNEFRLRMVPAGKRFVNLLWAGEQIGSLASHKSRPMQLLVTTDPEELVKRAPQLKNYIEDASIGGQHAGIGDTRVHIDKIAIIADSNQQRALMDALLTGVLKTRAEGFGQKAIDRAPSIAEPSTSIGVAHESVHGEIRAK